jgi:tetratricopeptide (TPR) repeat protein
LNPQHSYIHGRLVRILEEQGKESEAFEYLIQMLSLQKTEPEKIEGFKAAYTNKGWQGVILERIKLLEADPNASHFWLACLYARAGERVKALDSLEKAYEERSFMIAVIQVEPQLDSLRGDPRYVDLIKKIGLPPIGAAR